MQIFPGLRPKSLGAKDGKLAPTPRAPNAVSSQADPIHDPDHNVAPFGCNGDPDGTWKRLVERVRALPGAKVITSTDSYLHAECSTKLFGFTDDLELLLDRASGLIHVRSAARLGRRDFGVNRARIESLRAQLAAAR